MIQPQDMNQPKDLNLLDDGAEWLDGDDASFDITQTPDMIRPVDAVAGANQPLPAQMAVTDSGLIVPTTASSKGKKTSLAGEIILSSDVDNTKGGTA
ncbi:Uncharacterised protein [Yersinia enterocolitica]|nr:Uncharacterised protein [Yersinia enterocolitica]